MYAAVKAVLDGEVLIPSLAREAGILLGGVEGMWVNPNLVRWLQEQNPMNEESLITAIKQWESANARKLSDPGLRATRPRDQRLGHIPWNHRLGFGQRWAHRCPLCGEEIRDLEVDTLPEQVPAEILKVWGYREKPPTVYVGSAKTIDEYCHDKWKKQHGEE